MKLVTNVNFVKFHKNIFLAKLLVLKHGNEVCAITVLFRFSPETSPKNAKNAGFNCVFGLIAFLNTDAVLDHLPESIKVKFVWSHDIKKQLLYCLA